MNNQGNYRIITAYGDTASVWTISNFFSTVAWDDDPKDVEVMQAEDIKQRLEDGRWEKIEADASEGLPRSFKYYHVDEGPEYVNSWHNDGTAVSYCGEEFSGWDAEKAKSFIERGIWIVVPEEKNFIDTLQLKIEIDGVKEAYEMLDEMAEKSNTLLESIESFTSGTGHDVFISEGVYKVYRKDEDMPYVCNTDEQVVAVMDALITLDEADTQ